MRAIPALTGIRGLAAIWVMLYHINSTLGVHALLPFVGPPLPVIADGWLGVDLFFILSGFILFYVHQADFESISTDNLGMFYLQRAFRVYPVSIFTLCLIALIVLSNPELASWYQEYHERSDFTAIAFFKTFFLLNRIVPPFQGDWNQPTWSLSTELIGYLCFPVLAYLVNRSCRSAFQSVLVAVISIGMLVALTFVFGKAEGNNIGAFGNIRMIGCFIFGISLCKTRNMMPSDIRRRCGPLGDACVAMIVLLCVFVPQKVLIVPFLGLLIFSLSCERGLANSVCKSRLVFFAGQISYSLYLIHVIILMTLRYYQATGALRDYSPSVLLVSYVLLCMILATATHLVVEKPIHVFSKRYVAARMRRLSRPATGPIDIHADLPTSALRQ